MLMLTSCSAIWNKPLAPDDCSLLDKITLTSPIIIESDKWIAYQTDVASALEVIENPMSTPREIELAIGNIRLWVGANRDIVTKKTARQIRDNNVAFKQFCEPRIQPEE